MCRAVLPNDATFCVECGTPIIETSKRTSEETLATGITPDKVSSTATQRSASREPTSSAVQESTSPKVASETSGTKRTNLTSIIVLLLILAVSICSVFYMAYPSVQVIGSTTDTYASAGMLPYESSYLANIPTTETTYSASCLYNDCNDYHAPAYPVYSITFTATTIDGVGWVTTETSVQGTIYTYVTSSWSNFAPPYAYLGSSQNSTPTTIAATAVSLIVVFSFLLVALRRKPGSKATRPRTDETPKYAVSLPEPISGRCRGCGATLPPDSVFCEKCGTKVSIDTPTVTRKS